MKKNIDWQDRCSNNQAELLAIVKSLEWILVNKQDLSKDIIISTDSQVALDSIISMEEGARGALLSLELMDSDISLRKVRAHVGEVSNERADRLAKEAA